MENKWRFLSYRIQCAGVAAAALFWFVWLLALYMAAASGRYVFLVMAAGAVFAGVCIFAVLGIRSPYRRLDKNVQLFLSGYTASGLKNPDYILSPASEQLYETVIRLLESDQILNANKRQAQYLALQNQINPHFLYNTLESIRSEAMEAGIESVMNMTEALANFFRYTISNVENMVTLEEELDNIQTYFSIQKYRFEERIRLSVEFEPEDREMLLKCLMPKLTLQPIVENSIIHGIERKMGEGTVRIIIRRTRKRLIIQISDDGIGMAPEMLEKLNRQLNQPVYDSVRLSRNSGGIAIVNVNNRIHLIFGEEYGMSLYSTQGVGTDMVVTLPYVTSRRQVKGGEELR